MWQTALSAEVRRDYLLNEIVLRALLVLLFCVMNVLVQPHAYQLTDEQMFNCRRPRRDSFVPTWLMLIIILIIPLLMFSLPALFNWENQDTRQALLAWTLALTTNAFVTELIKLTVSRPRPDYFYRCYPDGEVIRVECMATKKLSRDVMDGRKSFPSGHSSCSFSSLGFLSIWLCGRLEVASGHRGQPNRVLCSLLPVLLAGTIALSRCWDNHHHWEDVLAGAALGLLSSYISYRQYYHPLASERSGLPYDTSFTMTPPALPEEVPHLNNRALSE